MKISTGPFRAFMKHNRLTHGDVAEASGLAKRTIDAMMQKHFTITTLIKVCKAYGIQLSDVVEICHDEFDDNSVECDKDVASTLRDIFMLCEAKRKDYLKSHTDIPSVAEIYRDAFLDCLDLCYEYLK